MTADDIAKSLNSLDGWTIEEGRLKKEYGFKGFTTAMEFMNRLAPLAEKLNHHPDWRNSYNRVAVSLMDHEARGLTKNDFVFAKAADETAKILQR